MRKTALIAGWVFVGVGVLLVIVAIADGLDHAQNVATMQTAATIAVAGAVLVAGALVAGALGDRHSPAAPAVYQSAPQQQPMQQPHQQPMQGAPQQQPGQRPF